jgi:hypothetical protein
MPRGGVDDAGLTCDRCDAPATRNWEGKEFLQLCQDCHRDLARWLDG